jgi:hypothetical protein
MQLIPYLEKAGPDFRPSLKLAYEEFLQYFPLCFGYWHKHAKLMRALEGEEAAAQVYERGLEAVNCPELHVYYCSFLSELAGPPAAKALPGAEATDESAGERRARGAWVRAVAEQGDEWLAEKLWDAYARFEESRGGAAQAGRVAQVCSLPPSPSFPHLPSFSHAGRVAQVCLSLSLSPSPHPPHPLSCSQTCVARVFAGGAAVSYISNRQ